MSRSVCIITTNKPPSILQSSSSSNSSIQILDPHTGSILSTSDGDSGGDSGGGGRTSSSSNNATIRINPGVGVHSLKPIQFGGSGHGFGNSNGNSNGNEHVYIAYGNQFKNNHQKQQHQNEQDMYAYLLVQGGGGISGSGSSSSKWKCKLPEYMSSALITSPCGYYIIGGGKSGTCYCWSTLSTSGSIADSGNGSGNNNGDDSGGSSRSELVSKWVAHYRSIKSIIFSDCGSYIITGGDDGIVNVWNLMDVVSSSSSSSYSSSSKFKSTSINPIQTWSEHHLPVTSMHSLPSSRIVSTSLDKQVIIMELFNGKTLAKINMTSSITNVISDMMGQRLYLGSIDGTIYCIDLNTYAIATTAESATVVNNNRLNSISGGNNGNGRQTAIPSLSGSMLEETVFGMNTSNGIDVGGNNTTISTTAVSTPSNASSHISEFRGHNRQISSLALIEDSGSSSSLLVSGSVDGSIRIWDIRSRGCIRTIHPWSTNNGILGQEQKSSGNGTNTSSSSNVVFPCSSISVIPREWIENSDDDDGGVFTSLSSHNGGGGSKRRRRKNQNNDSLVNLIKPLSRFTKREQGMDDDSKSAAGSDLDGFTAIFTKPLKENQLDFIEEIGSYDDGDCVPSTGSSKRPRIVTDNDQSVKNHENDNDSNDSASKEREIEMKSEIESLREEVKRWQKVNNKLMVKLKKVAAG